MGKDEQNETLEIHKELPITRDPGRMYYLAKDGYVHSVKSMRGGKGLKR